jgi:hypothetical protein
VEINRYSFNSLPGDGGGSGGTQSSNDSEWKLIDILLIFFPEMEVGLEESDYLMILDMNQLSIY